MTALSQARLVHVGPAPGRSGVGDYAVDFLAAVRPYVGEVVEVRTGGPGDDGLRDLRRTRRHLLRLLREPDAPPTIVHVELSGGGFVPWWATRRLRGVRLTATLHDPPWAIWWPWRTRGLTRYVVHHAIHYPTRQLSERLERRLMRGDVLFAMTAPGVEATRSALPTATVHRALHGPAPRPDLPPAETRPRAVGVYGYAYRDKGAERVRAIRAQLDPTIGIVVAGRGTEDLPPVPGVTVLGAVEGPAEDAFFASVQVVLVAQAERHSYGRAAYPSSGVIHRAVSYATPVVRVPSSIDEAGPGQLETGGDPAEIARTLEALLDDPPGLAALAGDMRRRRADSTPERSAESFVAVWSELLR